MPMRSEPKHHTPPVIFLNRFFFPDHSATSQMLSDLAFALARQEPARRIVIITSRQRYDAPQDRLAALETIDGVEVHRVWTSRFGRGNLVGRAFDYLTFYLSAAWQLWRIARAGDIVVAKTDPPMLSVVTGPVARLRGACCINWLQDIFPEVAEAIGTGGAKARPLYRGLRWFRDRSLRAADVNVVLGWKMAERMVGIGVPEGRIRTIPNWADGTVVVPVAHADNPLRAEWGLGSGLVVGYSGNLGRAHEIETFIGAIAELEGSAANGAPVDGLAVTWLFVGGGALLAGLKAAVAGRGLRSVIFKPYQPRERLAQSLSVADVHLVSLQPAMEGLIVPSKIYGIMAAGRPCIFIGDVDGEVARMIERHGCGRVVAQGDAAGLARTLRDMAADTRQTRQMGERARQALMAEFDQSIAVERWTRMLQEVGSPGKSRTGAAAS